MDMWKQALSYMADSESTFRSIKESIADYNVEHGTNYCLATRGEDGLEEV